MNKRLLFLCFVVLFFLSACQNPGIKKEPLDTSDVMHKSNYIVPYQVTDTEEELLRLVCSGDSINIYNFAVNNDINSVTVWCEEYENGQLAYTHLEQTSEISGRGRIAIRIDNTELHIAVAGDSNRSSTVAYTTNYNIYCKPSNSLRRQTEIKPDDEIALSVYAIIAAEDDKNEYLQIPNFYIENPDRLSDFDRVYIFKCKFSEDMD